MEHLIKIAFWIFTFSPPLSGCNPVNRIYLPDFKIDLMKDQIKCEENASFYTPRPIKEKCNTSALECIYKELNGVAAVECEDPYDRIKSGLLALEKEINKQKNNTGISAQTSDLECICESWSKTNFTVFLENYKSILEKNNALH